MEGHTMYKWKKLDTDFGHAFYGPLEEAVGTQDGFPKRRSKIQDLVRHSLMQCGAQDPSGRVPRGKLVRGLQAFQRKAYLNLRWIQCYEYSHPETDQKLETQKTTGVKPRSNVHTNEVFFF